jgi:hypothetical protein
VVARDIINPRSREADGLIDDHISYSGGPRFNLDI